MRAAPKVVHLAVQSVDQKADQKADSWAVPSADYLVDY